MPQVKTNYRRGTFITTGLPASGVASFLLSGMAFISGSQFYWFDGAHFVGVSANLSASGT